MSVVAYLVAVALAFVEPFVSCSLYALVAVVWLVPDRRIETTLKDDESGPAKRGGARSESSDGSGRN